MNTREQFGRYLLLKKLTEDPLGETFRAGMLGSAGMERVVLLRVFNGQGLDAGRLWAATRDRARIQSGLKSPNIGEGVDMGELQGVPYVAYDYTSAKNLATLEEQATKKRNPIPTEHALLITERLALALAAANETRLDGVRLEHGFLVPHLAMISNEGETRLLGFEVGPGLRGFASNPVIRQHFGRYLAPELLDGKAPDRSDDLFSLGAILLELLTGRPLPPTPAGGHAALIDQSTLAVEGTPIPEALANLLKQSLTPRAQRIQDANTWHKTLNSWMFEGHYNPTTFNLAFYMHNLFRQEIERESQEIEVEKTLPLPTVDPADYAPQTQVAPTRESTGVGPPPAPPSGAVATTPVTGPVATTPPEKKKGGGLLLVLAAIALVLIGGAAAYYFLVANREAPVEEVAAIPEPVIEEPPPLPPGPTPEELAEKERELEELMLQRATAMEDEIRKQFDAELEAMQSEINDARKAVAERQRILDEREAQRLEREEEAARQAAAEQAAAEAEAAAAAAAEEEPPAEEVEVAEAAPPPPPEPPPPPPPTTPQVRRGDLVQPDHPGLVKPVLTQMPRARFPEMARRLNKTDATVVVRVLVDENGKVLDAELINEEVGFGFDDSALQAARNARYRAAKVGNVPVKIWATIRIEFQ